MVVSTTIKVRSTQDILTLAVTRTVSDLVFLSKEMQAQTLTRRSEMHKVMEMLSITDQEAHRSRFKDQ